MTARTAKQLVPRGVIAGLFAGTVSAIVAVTISLALGENLWVGAKMAAYPFVGERVLQPTFDPVLILGGVLTHFAVSVGWGVAFAVLMHGRRIRSPIIAGIIWGIVVWLVMFYLVLPLVDAEEIARLTPVWRALIEHVIFGLSVSFGCVCLQPFPPPNRKRRASAPFAR